jgi:hypothetical protein
MSGLRHGGHRRRESRPLGADGGSNSDAARTRKLIRESKMMIAQVGGQAFESAAVSHRELEEFLAEERTGGP